LTAKKTKPHWGHYCLVLAVLVCLIQYYIALTPNLDAATTMGTFRTHHIFEILGFFFLGLGASKSIKNTILSQITIWTALLAENVINITYIATFWPLDLTGPTLLLNFPMFVSFYSYKIYVERHKIREFGEKLDKAIPFLGLIIFQLMVQGVISLILIEPSMFILFARAIIFVAWLFVLFSTIFLSLMEIV